MKNKIMRNLGLKILSLVVAFMFWLVIINMTDPVTSRTFYNIPVQILNENIITSSNQVYEVVSGDQVNVTVKGKRSLVETLTSSNFEASADLSELSKVNAVNVDVKLVRTSPKTDTRAVELSCDNAVLKVKLEKRVTRKFRVEVQYQGELSENYELGDIVAKPNIVEVSCGESKFRQIDHVGVMVQLNGESEDFERTYQPLLYDSDGAVLDTTNVSFSNDSIVVSIGVRQTKEVPVRVDVTGTPAAGYRLVQTDIRPETIRVTGSKEALKAYTSVHLPVDIDGARGDVEKEIALEDYIPEGLSVVGDTLTVSVRCDIEKDGRRSFILSATDIAVRNLPQNCTMDFSDPNVKCQVVVSADEDKLEDLAMTDLGAYIDLSGLGSGIHNLEIKYTLPEGITVKESAWVQVILTFQEDGSTSAPATATPSPTATATASEEPKEE